MLHRIEFLSFGKREKVVYPHVVENVTRRKARQLIEPVWEILQVSIRALPVDPRTDDIHIAPVCPEIFLQPGFEGEIVIDVFLVRGAASDGEDEDIVQALVQSAQAVGVDGVSGYFWLAGKRRFVGLVNVSGLDETVKRRCV